MSDTKFSQPKAIYNPGELDATRKNLGELSPEEARRMATILGGEVGVEKSPKFENFVSKKGDYDKSYRPTSNSAKSVNAKRTNQVSDEKNASKGKKSKHSENTETSKKYQLPQISSKEKSKFDRLMGTSEYKIKRPQGFLNFILSIGKTPDRVSADFITVRLVNYIGHMQKFFSSMRMLLEEADTNYRMKIMEYQTSHFRFLNFVNTFDLSTLRNIQRELAKDAENVTVADMVPFVKEFYKQFLKIFYLGEPQVVVYIRDTFKEITGDRKLRQEALMPHVRSASSEWIYIYNQIIKGLYPLLMRMVSTEVLPFAKFFNQYGPKILTFAELTRFELILPDADGEEALKRETERVKKAEDEKFKEMQKEKEEEANKKDSDSGTAQDDDESDIEIPAHIKKAFNALEMLFPDAHWMQVARGADFFPYFQPFYKFADGFNLLGPDNPMQFTIVLLRILEDLFQGCRNIKFIDEKEGADDYYKDSISDVFSDWSAYQQNVFEKDYLPVMKEVTNHVSTQPEFIKTPYARKQLAVMWWETKMMFLPYLEYEYFFMEKKYRASSYKPLPHRLTFLKKSWTALIKRIEEERLTAKNGGREFSADIAGCENIMDTYTFAVPNIVSKRLDLLYPLKNRTNLTLLKYAYNILLILDWWVNDKNSPAYSMETEIPYRTDENGNMMYSVPVRSDQNIIFNRMIKARQAAQNAASNQSAQGNAQNANQAAKPSGEKA